MDPAALELLNQAIGALQQLVSVSTGAAPGAMAPDVGGGDVLSDEELGDDYEVMDNMADEPEEEDDMVTMAADGDMVGDDEDDEVEKNFTADDNADKRLMDPQDDLMNPSEPPGVDNPTKKHTATKSRRGPSAIENRMANIEKSIGNLLDAFGVEEAVAPLVKKAKSDTPKGQTRDSDEALNRLADLLEGRMASPGAPVNKSMSGPFGEDENTAGRKALAAAMPLLLQ